jgi:hypothetical protein
MNFFRDAYQLPGELSVVSSQLSVGMPSTEN